MRDSMSELPEDISHDQHAVRLKKLQDMRTAGFDPFRASVEQTHFSAEAMALHVEGQDNAVTVKVAGRLVVIRDMGKSQFVKILDQQGHIQLYLKKTSSGKRLTPLLRNSIWEISLGRKALCLKRRRVKSPCGWETTCSLVKPCAHCLRNGMG